jgi:hypothetical protein
LRSPHCTTALCSLLIELGMGEMGLMGWLRGLGKRRSPGEEILVDDGLFLALFEDGGTSEESASDTPGGGGGGGEWEKLPIKN